MDTRCPKPHSAAGWVGLIYTVVEYKGKESSAKGGGAQVVEYSWCVLAGVD